MSEKRRNFETRHFGFCIIFIQLVLKVQSFSSPANTENGCYVCVSVDNCLPNFSQDVMDLTKTFGYCADQKNKYIEKETVQ